eukprot:1021621-Rhodomonas_salina.3
MNLSIVLQVLTSHMLLPDGAEAFVLAIYHVNPEGSILPTVLGICYACPVPASGMLVPGGC